MLSSTEPCTELHPMLKEDSVPCCRRIRKLKQLPSTNTSSIGITNQLPPRLQTIVRYACGSCYFYVWHVNLLPFHSHEKQNMLHSLARKLSPSSTISAILTYRKLLQPWDGSLRIWLGPVIPFLPLRMASVLICENQY